MKYSQLLGLLACALQIAACFVPWSVVAEQHIIITGMNAAVRDYGKPGLLTAALSAIMSICFIITTIWVKRMNVIIAAINIAWCVRNFLLMSACQGGECPEKQAGIYLLLCLSAFIIIMTFLPPIRNPAKQQ